MSYWNKAPWDDKRMKAANFLCAPPTRLHSNSREISEFKRAYSVQQARWKFELISCMLICMHSRGLFCKKFQIKRIHLKAYNKMFYLILSGASCFLHYQQGLEKLSHLQRNLNHAQKKAIDFGKMNMQSLNGSQIVETCPCGNQKLRGTLRFFNINTVGSTHYQQSSHLAPRVPLLHVHAWPPFQCTTQRPHVILLFSSSFDAKI